MKECLRKAVHNGHETFHMLKSSHTTFQRRSHNAASQLQKALKTRDSTRG